MHNSPATARPIKHTKPNIEIGSGLRDLKGRRNLFITALILSGALSGVAVAQTVTTYSYDTLGRLVEANPANADVETFEHDAAGNITRAVRGAALSSNQPPSCTSGLHSSLSQFYTFAVLPSCSDPDGDAMSVVSASVSSGQAFVSVNNNLVTVSGIDNYEYIEVTVAVIDSFGNPTLASHGIAGPGGGEGGGPPPF